jgi:uncharacterized protein (TIGR03083 family)
MLTMGTDRSVTAPAVEEDRVMATMTETTILDQARAALGTVAGRTAHLLRSLSTTEAAIPGAEWKVRDAAAHLVSCLAIYCEVANGMPSPIEPPPGELDPRGRPIRDGERFQKAVALNNARRLADLPERDPRTLAQLVLDGAGRLIDTTAGRRGDQRVSFHWGLPFTLDGVVCCALSEQILHGYDMATAAGHPWPIDPGHAALVVHGLTPLFELAVSPQTTRALTVAYEVELRGVGRSVVRFVDGEFSVGPGYGDPVDCTISADPVGYLLVGAGRLSPWTAIALGLMSAGGPHPELAPRFSGLFIYP